MAERARAIPELLPERIAAKLASGDRPYVTLKAAATLDGKIATRSGESQWITGEEARAFGHELRAAHDAVLVGINTVIRDDPQLTSRSPHGMARGARIVLDSTCRIPLNARVLASDGAARFVVGGSEAPAERVESLRREGVRVFQAPARRAEPAQFLPWLRRQGLNSILVEGGAAVHGALIANCEADELFLFLAGRLMGDAAAPDWCGALGISRLAEMPRLCLSPPRRIGEDVLVHGLFLRPEGRG